MAGAKFAASPAFAPCLTSSSLLWLVLVVREWAGIVDISEIRKADLDRTEDHPDLSLLSQRVDLPSGSVRR
jgi:hypothetical protein